jgi:hypothetical protein
MPWMAHSNESNVCVDPPTVISIVLSYSFPHTSHVAMAPPVVAVTRSHYPGAPGCPPPVSKPTTGAVVRTGRSPDPRRSGIAEMIPPGAPGA